MTIKVEKEEKEEKNAVKLSLFLNKIRDYEINIWSIIIKQSILILTNKNINEIKKNGLPSKNVIVFCKNPNLIKSLSLCLKPIRIKTLILFSVNSLQPCVFKISNIDTIHLPKEIVFLPFSTFLFSTIRYVNLENVKLLSNNCFYNSSIVEVTLSKELLEIPENCFALCMELRKVNIPKDSKLLSIRNSAFNGCKKLRNIYLPDHVHDIGVASFNNCDYLQEFKYPKNINYIFNNFNKGLKKVEIPKKLIGINGVLKRMFHYIEYY